jgi:hypothetical protein
MVAEVQFWLLLVAAAVLPGIVFHSLLAVLVLTCHLTMLVKPVVAEVVEMWFLALVAAQLLSTVRSLL